MFFSTTFIYILTLTFDHLTSAVSDELSVIHPMHIPILASYDYPFLSYAWLNLITLPSHETITAHVPCHVTYHRRA